MKKKGFFGGTFDPPHFGHLNLAIHLQEIYGLEEVLFCPAAVSPFKVDQVPLASPKHRAEMVRQAILPIPSFQLCSIELEKTGPSYTIDTVKKIYRDAEKRGEDLQLYLLLGEDSLNNLEQWKDIEELLVLAAPLVGTRRSFTPEKILPLSYSIQKKIKEGWVTMPNMDISSTIIRERLYQKLFCGHLLPETVLDYIYKHNLYS